jgi:glutathione peroxidase
MKKLIVIFLMSMPVFGLLAQNEAENAFYGFTVKTIDGKDFAFSQLKGKKVLIVNTASKCGNTPQYEVLQSVWKEYGGDDFVIIGFPANNFAGQEPGTNEQIMEFCTSSYSVTFPMMAKISVKGSEMHSLYKWLTDKKLNGVMDSEVKWNFQKYLIDETGRLSAVIQPRESVRSEQVLAWLAK